MVRILNSSTYKTLVKYIHTLDLIILHFFTTSTHRFWPVVTFFTIIVGVPWLLWRLLSSAGIFLMFVIITCTISLPIVSESTDISMESW